MTNFWRLIWAIIAFVLRRYQDHTASEELSSGTTADDMRDAEVPVLTPVFHPVRIDPLPFVRTKPAGIARLNVMLEAMRSVAQEFDEPLDALPTTRSEVRRVFGRAPKEPPITYEPKAELAVYTFPGSWNGREKNPRLYVHTLFEPYLREALKLCSMLDVLHTIESIGAYNHRHIRHNINNPLSLHAWAIAADINSSGKYTRFPQQNRGISRHLYWMRRDGKGKYVGCDTDDQRSRRGPIPLPFTKDWHIVYRGGSPFELVMAFKAVGLTWGGDWGRDSWIPLVLKHGVGYDPSKLKGKNLADYKDALHEWKNVSYCDSMHWEAFERRGKFMREWM